ncbi:protein-export chaperone SecB [Salinicoccus roseus]|uniref:protein-export chaperone SecB n=1 Tax=Salinicoccus roseus TaxID=45670 RepID=UPI000F4F40D5|nr:protein-export chaperone SecB [Salinicoccus roseus]RPE52900.1 preprotein translocase subunit SecB [Salinicoccus roseus]GGA72477.1 hypothetical protein GCM10007176_15780 [Salinicoccus roseus]
MAGLTFENYFISKMHYENNKNFVSDENPIDIDPHFAVKIFKSEHQAVVNLGFTAGELEQEDSPFLVEVEISGLFSYVEEEADSIAFEDFLTNNAVALLFPYLRQVVSNLTAASNQFPTFILPVMNIAQLLKEEGNIDIIEDSNN